MLRTIFTFSLGTMFGVALARRCQKKFQSEGLLSSKNDPNKKVVVSHSTVEQQKRP